MEITRRGAFIQSTSTLAFAVRTGTFAVSMIRASLGSRSATRCAKGACPAIEAVRYSQTSIGGVLVIVGLVLLFQCTWAHGNPLIYR